MTTSRPENAARYLPRLDGLRGAALLLVFFEHASNRLFPQAWIDRLGDSYDPGYLGVMIFFVLSGFLITRIIVASEPTARGLARFLTRRFLRIFPAYYLLLAAMALAWPSRDVAWSASYLSNYYLIWHRHPSPLAHTWSLCIEEHFYLIWPLALFALPGRKARTAIVGALAAAALGSRAYFALAFHHHLRKDLLFHSTQSQLVCLLAGSALALYESELTARGERLARAALAAGAALLAVFAVSVWREADWPPLATAFWMDAAGVCATVYSIFGGGRVRGVLEAPALRFIGRISYGLYLYHYPIFCSFGVFAHPASFAPLRALGALAASAAAACLSYRFVESPLLRLKDRFAEAAAAGCAQRAASRAPNVEDLPAAAVVVG